MKAPFFVSSTHHIIRNHWTETFFYDGLSNNLLVEK